LPQTQLYFADACRLPEGTRLEGLGSGVTLPWNENQSEDKRSAPIYYSALPGMAALGVKQKGTFFTQALVECLDNLALCGPNRKSSNPLEQQFWHVSVPGLLSPLNQRVRALAEAKAIEIGVDLPEQGVTMGGEARPAVFHVLPSPPKVQVLFDLRDDTLAKVSQAALFLPTRQAQVSGWTNCWPKPCRFELVDAGLYSLDVLNRVTGIVVVAEPPETKYDYPGGA
jgi:hypothetical protein